MKKERNYKKCFVQLISFIMALVILVATQQIAFADQSPVGCIAYVTASKLHLRDKPQGNIVSDIRKGETVTILSEMDRNGYYYVMVNKTNKEYYAYGEYLRIEYGTHYREPTYSDIEVTPTPVEDENSEWENQILVVVSDKQLNLRKRSNRKAPRIKYLEYGDRLQVVSTRINNNYILVRDLQEGKVGYVDINYVVFESEYTVPTELCDCCPNCSCIKY